MEAEMRAFMYSPEDEEVFGTYREDYEAAFVAAHDAAHDPAGYETGFVPAGLNIAACARRRSARAVTDTVEEQIRKKQEAREIQGADRKRAIAERELLKEVREPKGAVPGGGSGKSKKAQKKGKSRKTKK